MSSFYFARLGAALAAFTFLALNGMPVRAGGCGCEAPSQTVYHVHQRCHGHCRHCPPTGMIVQSAPVMSAPMMAAPMMAAPVMAAPMMMAPIAQQSFAAPTVSFAPAQNFTLTSQPSLQLSLAQQSTCGAASNITQEQLVRALSMLANDSSNSSAAALRSTGRSAEDRLADLERRVSKLEKNTEDIVEVIKGMQNSK